ncbi:MAG: hypothetical protein CEN88_284 [Candidatus Berkelbacteria bacterium Licking1014_2]|uniref:Rod shape-determining protein MreD n=1 Tax=Candidatus Berkelbacteria bacterium Licking1014_2 TaxID=2017146 RepID=A0A554LV47_9BACT|nr:MAG: hypothetical protein CEN88_284 [Candidatus Berkelbacteria bacterium Licking1014_2]
MVYFLLILALVTRFLPHPANFTAVGAVALFAGYYIKDKRLALILPLLAMALSDWLIGFYYWPIMGSVYLSFVATGALGIFSRRWRWWSSIFFAAVSAVIFFLITNWAVWQFGNWYPHTTDGLWLCYLAGLPFFKPTLLGNLVYTAALFSLAELAARLKSHSFTLSKSNLRG